MAAHKADNEAEKDCPQCGYPIGASKSAKPTAFPLGRSLSADVLFFALQITRHHLDIHDPRSNRVLRVLYALWLATVRGDIRGLDGLVESAERYLAGRAVHEQWSVDGWLTPNAKVLEAMIDAMSLKLSPDERVRVLLQYVVSAFPWLPGVEQLERLRNDLLELVQKELAPVALVQAALQAAGMSATEVHARLAFLRSRKSRAKGADGA